MVRHIRRGITRFSGGEWKIFDKSNGLGNNSATALYSTTNESGESILYAGTEKGLLKYENEKWTEIPLTDEFSLLEVWNISETKTASGKRELIIAASYGIFRKSEEGKTVYNKESGLPDRRVRDALETVSAKGEKTLWAATYSGGLAKLSGEKWTVFDDKTGFPVNKVYTLAEIKVGNARQLWAGTGGGGIAVFDLDQPDGKSQTINTKNSRLLPSDTIYKILQHPNGDIYATTTKGVARIKPQPDKVFSGFDAYFFTTEDGLPENVEEGNGLLNMQARTAEIGGKIEINSETGEGTTIILHIPRRNIGFSRVKQAEKTY